MNGRGAALPAGGAALWLRWAAALAILLCAACGDDDGAAKGVVTSASAVRRNTNPLMMGVVLPPAVRPEVNPLDLPMQQIEAQEKGRVFTIPFEMLDNAKVGSAMVLRSAKVLGREGELLNVRIGTGKPYLVHPANVVVPQQGKLRRGAPVFAGYRGMLKHGVLRHTSSRGAVIRFTDLGFRMSDQTIPRDRLGVLPSSLAPGAYAVMRGEHAYEHVTLISGSGAGAARRGFVLGRDGEARLVPEAQLQPMTVAKRHRYRAGDSVLVAFRGLMVPAKIRNIDHPGLYNVQRRRAGGSLTVGPGMLMPARP